MANAIWPLLIDDQSKDLTAHTLLCGDLEGFQEAFQRKPSRTGENVPISLAVPSQPLSVTFFSIASFHVRHIFNFLNSAVR